ncbi:hypothetical protein GCM10023235_45760 [Kitasatospora terrestris]|uniref:Uncharacterized protein n=1 Tax=Kitasatospora terrestris TaxID=258051 RepID=A0ABP9E0W9_9ACTN
MVDGENAEQDDSEDRERLPGTAAVPDTSVGPDPAHRVRPRGLPSSRPCPALPAAGCGGSRGNRRAVRRGSVPAPGWGCRCGAAGPVPVSGTGPRRIPAPTFPDTCPNPYARWHDQH